MLDFDRLRAPPMFGHPQRPPFHLVYGPYRHEMGVPRFRRPHRPIHYSTKVQGPKQYIVLQRNTSKSRYNKKGLKRPNKKIPFQQAKTVAPVRNGKTGKKSPILSKRSKSKMSKNAKRMQKQKNVLSSEQLDKQLNKYYESDATVMQQRMDNDLENYFSRNVETTENSAQVPAY